MMCKVFTAPAGVDMPAAPWIAVVTHLTIAAHRGPVDRLGDFACDAGLFGYSPALVELADQHEARGHLKRIDS